MSPTSTTPSSSAAATTGSPTRRTSPRPGCARWSWSARACVGGAAITEEIVPGFSFTTFSYALSLLRPEIIQELDLVKHGFLPLMMPSSFHPTGDGDYLLFGDDHQQNLQEIRRHSPRDADAYERYHYDLDRVCQAVRPLFDNPPPNIFGKDPEDAVDVKWLLDHLGGVEQKVDARRGPAAHRQRRRLAGRLLRARGDQGLPRVLVDHRLQGRPDVARLRPGPAVPQAGRARRPPRLVGVPQGRQRRLHPGAGRAPRRRTAPRSGSRRRSTRVSPRTAARSASPSTTAPSSARRSWSPRSTRGVPSSSWSTRAELPLRPRRQRASG